MKLDYLFDNLEKKGLIMGSVAISKDGIIQYKRATGYSLIEINRKITANSNTKYRIGSESKIFTAVMIFQLIEENKISLNQKLDVFFPSLPNAKNITIGNLLNHRSGLPDYTQNTNFQNWMDKPKTHEEMIELIREKDVVFNPGTKSEYSNTNYLILSYIIEKIDNIPYKDAVNKRIISKIGLHNTYYGEPINETKNESFSYIYHSGNWEKEKETDMSIHVGAGSMVSTPADLVIFIDSLFSYKLLNKISLKQMTTFVDGYGMGLFPFEYNKHKAIGHNGRIEEFYSTLQYYPKNKLAISYITNGILYPRADIVNSIVSICFNENSETPFFAPTKTENLDNYLGEYMSSQIPIKVLVTKKINNELCIETQGNKFELQTVRANYFMDLNFGYFFEFFPDMKELVVKEKDNVYVFKKE